MSTFAERQPGLYPTALRGRWGIAWGRAFGAQKDDVVTAAKDAVKSGFVAIAPADALPRHAADVALPLLPGETDAQLRARVAGAWDFWPMAGTLAGLETAADLLGYVDRTIRTARDLSRDPGKRARMGTSARAFVEERFNRDDQAELFVRSLVEALAG